tara:strand:+ start:4461 stop:4967 length:507 start_codon:yes stop_codon:yes gene_type:complete
MATIKDFTPAEFKTLLDEYFAPPEQRSKMSEDEIISLAQQLNKKINVPLIRETGEEKILIKIVLKIDGFLYNNLPNEVYGLMRDLDQGISDKEAKRLVKRLSKLANDKIDIPYIPERMEGIAIRFVISVIINSARKKWDITKAAEGMALVTIPENIEDAGAETNNLFV